MASNEESQTIDRGAKERSQIAFSYVDLESAIGLARVVRDRFGRSCDVDQLAPASGHEGKTSGAFRNRLSAAFHFGLLERDRDKITLTTLGAQIVEPTTEAQARVTAFLNVPLHRALFDDYKGKMLPSDKGLEHHIRNLGVAAKQSDRARQVFRRSAENAGLFGFGKDRLVLPPGTSQDGSATSSLAIESTTPKQSIDSRVLTSDAGLHPAVAGMLAELPPQGTTWSEGDLKSWSETFESVLRVVYKVGKGGGRTSVE